MHPSHVEEIIAVLWSILAVLLFIADAPNWAVGLVALKAAGDHACAIHAAIKHLRSQKP